MRPVRSSIYQTRDATTSGRRKEPASLASGLLDRITIRLRQSTGTTKKMRTAGVTGSRSAAIVQTSECPVDIQNFVVALEFTQDVGSILELWRKYPRLFTDPFLLNRVANVGRQNVRRSTFLLNFAIPLAIVNKIDEASRQLIGHASSAIDLTSPARSSALVVKIVTQLRGFTEKNISQLKSFYKLKALHASYVEDLQWLKRMQDMDDVDSRAVRYMQLHMVSPASDILQTLRASALRSEFAVRTTQENLRMTITVSSILGFLGRSARLNDSVLMYALRQLATDFEGVHVVESLRVPVTDLPGSASPNQQPFMMPGIPLRALRFVLFPLNYDRIYWCIICVRISTNGSFQASLYDPLQCGYASKMHKSWESECEPLLTRWLARDGIPVPAPARVQVTVKTAQHDSTSCGVYCLAWVYEKPRERGAVDGDSEEKAEYDEDECEAKMEYSQSESSSTALLTQSSCQEWRLRTMWRILCDSEVIDKDPEYSDARDTIEWFEKFSG